MATKQLRKCSIQNRYISVITELELLSFGNMSNVNEIILKDFLKQCKIININDFIKDETIRIRKKYKTKLPDSIIIATALYLDLPIISADSDFKKIDELNFIYYAVLH